MPVGAVPNALCLRAVSAAEGTALGAACSNVGFPVPEADGVGNQRAGDQGGGAS
jgi:hypothetical protein